jgi:sterol desaturase/sphingolipid hydroxylase (fatty acid hydroxylase superfamily)
MSWRLRMDDAVQPEKLGRLWLGLLVHVGPLVAYAALLELTGMTVWTAILAFAVIGLPLTLLFIFLEMTRPARALRAWQRSESLWEIARLFLESFALGYVLLGGSWWLVDRALAWLTDKRLIENDWLGVVAAIVLLDFAYYWWHRLVLHGHRHRRWITKFMRRTHAVHHEVTDIDLFRGNVFSRWDAFWSHQFPLGVICALLGLSLPATLVAFSLTMFGFSSHHVNHTFRIGWLRRVLIDNHAHKLHHCRGGSTLNFGNFFSIWDRLFGTYHEDWSRCATDMHARGVRVTRRRQ